MGQSQSAWEHSLSYPPRLESDINGNLTPSEWDAIIGEWDATIGKWYAPIRQWDATIREQDTIIGEWDNTIRE